MKQSQFKRDSKDVNADYYNSGFYAKVKKIMQSDQISEGAAITKVITENPDLHLQTLNSINGLTDGLMSDVELLAKFKGKAAPLDRLAATFRRESPTISEGESYRRACHAVYAYDKGGK